MSSGVTRTPPSRAYLVWGCGALFYMYQFVVRVSPSILVKDLMDAFRVDASTVGSLAALAMYAYSILQIPSGLLADRYGIRRVILGSLSLCITGIALVGLAQDLWMAQIGRLLIGAGSSSAFLSSAKIAGTYFPSTQRATLFGLTMAAGTVGALNGGAPLCYLVSKIGWRQSLLALSGLGVFFLFLTSRVLNSPSSGPLKQEKLNEGLLNPLRASVTNGEIWTYSVIAVGLYLSVSVLADLWGPSFLMERLRINAQKASELTGLIYVGLFFGSLTVPWLSDRLKKRKAVITACSLGIFIFLCLLIYSPGVSIVMASTVLFLTGFCAGAEMLCFAGACESALPSATATVTGLVNGVVMLSAACTQHQVGKLLDYFWSGQVSSENIRFYSLLEYQYSLVLLPVAAALSFFVALTLQERELLRS